MQIVFVVVALTVAVSSAGCGGGAQSPVEGARDLTQAIGDVSGTFAWRADLDRYEYSEKARLEEILSTRPGEENVRLLIDCLDQMSPSHSTIDGTPVPVGIVCYEALTQTVYYEPPGPNGDIAANWPGNVSPKASPQEMRAAKDAWTEVAEAKAFTFQ